MTDRVIMSTFAGDSLEWLQCAVASVLTAEGSPKLVIGVDGPVPPSHGRYLEVLAEAHPEQVCVLAFPNNRGLASVLNDLIEVAMADATCEFVFRMDADDVSDRRRFSVQREALLADPEVDVLGAWADVIDESGSAVGVITKPVGHETLCRRLAYDSPFIHPTVAFRASALRKGVRYPTATIAFEDVAMWSQMALSGSKFSNVPLVLLRYRQSPSTFRRRTGWRKVWSELSVRLGYMVKSRPGRIDIALLVVTVGIAKAVLPLSLVRKLFELRAKLNTIFN